MNRNLSLSFIFFGATIACKPLPGPDKAPSSVEDAEDAQFESTDRPEQTVEDDGGEDATTEEDGEVDIGDIGDTGETGTTEEPDEGFDREPMSAEAFSALADDARAERTQVLTFDASYYGYVVGSEGTIVQIPTGSLVDDEGARVSGRVDVELIELYDKGSMLVTDMPSTGLTETGERAQLISGGEHYVNATQDGEQLTLVNYIQIDAPVANTGDPSTDMVRFRAIAADGAAAGMDNADVWVEEDDKVALGRAEGADGVQTTYSLLTSQFGWTNVDRWYSDPREKTTLEVRPPVGWDDSNSAAYLSYDGEPTALARLDTWDGDEGIFSEHYGLIPVGLEVHVIFVTATETGWAYAIQGATIAAGQEIAFDDADTLIDIDTDGLVDVVNALP